MHRREFIKRFVFGLAATWAAIRLPWPRPAYTQDPILRLAFLADAHLKNGDPARPEALALARAVAEIRALRPAPELVLFAGDLAHDGNPQALALGREILTDLPAPVLAVRGEGDGPAEASAAWKRLFGEDRFTHNFKGINIIGLNTALGQISGGPAFTLGEGQLRWLTQELRRLDPAAPLIILSHAPLTPIFRPWGQCTTDAHRLAPHLVLFRRVLLLHGHVHQAGVRGQRPESNFLSKPIFPAFCSTENLPVPATSWPLPSPLQGTPRRLQPGLAPQGCGWGLLTLRQDAWDFRPQIWQA